jgi:hypothetical protein
MAQRPYDIAGTRRKRSAPRAEDCHDCASLAPRSGAPSTCVKISFNQQMRRFRIPLPISVDTIRKICHHCYGISGNVTLACVRAKLTPACLSSSS